MAQQSSRDKAKYASIQKRKTSQSSKGAKGIVRLYLLAYNVASLLGWSYILYRLIDHLSTMSSSFTWASLFPGHQQHRALLARASTSYADFGDVTRWVQTTALLEVVHVALGLVRSSLGTTASQVASRLVLVWGILLQFPISQTSPVFSSMVFAWSVAEIVRYSTYALGLFNIKLYPLEWLRYTLFYILYPLGAGSEAYLMYISIPWAKYKYGQPGMLALMALVMLWPPALLTLMSHMHQQRAKHIGGKSKAKKH